MLGTYVKSAVTRVSSLTVTLQTPLPLHAPLHPSKRESGSGVARNVSVEPTGIVAEHVAPQLIAAGVLVITPLPPPLLETVTRPCFGAVPTETVTVPVLDSTDPSHAANVKVSMPENPGSGMYVALVPAIPARPCAGRDTIRSVSGFESASTARTVIDTAVAAFVDAFASLATGARLRDLDSLSGPSWQA